MKFVNGAWQLHLLGTFNETTKEFQRAGAYENKFAIAAMKAKGKKDARPFHDKPASIRPIHKHAYRRNA